MDAEDAANLENLNAEFLPHESQPLRASVAGRDAAQGLAKGRNSSLAFSAFGKRSIPSNGQEYLVLSFFRVTDCCGLGIHRRESGPRRSSTSTTTQGRSVPAHPRATCPDSPATPRAQLHAHVVAGRDWLAGGRSDGVARGRYRPKPQNSYGAARCLAREGEFAQVRGQRESYSSGARTGGTRPGEDGRTG